MPFFEWADPGFGSISAIATGNADGVSGKELVIGANGVLHVVSAETGVGRVVSSGAGGPYSSLQLADVQGDGRPEVIFTTARSVGGEQVIVVDAETGVEIRRRLSLPFAMAGTPPLIETLDSNGDGKHEIVVGVFRTVALMDGATLDLRWTVPIEGAGIFSRFKLMKFNSDSVDDIVVATSERVLILDGRNGAELYRTPVATNGWVYDIAIGNMDVDSQLEIAIRRGQMIDVIDPYSGVTRTLLGSVQDAVGLRVENEGACSLVLVMTSSLERRTCGDGALLSTRTFPHGGAVFVGFPQTSHDDLITSDGQVLYRIRGAAIVAKSTVLGTRMGVNNFGALQTNGSSVTAYVGGQQGVNRVDLPFELLFRDGFDQR